MTISKFKFNKGKMLFWRVGGVNSVKQKHYGKEGHQPPCSRGIWAFPYPYFDYFFVAFQRDKYMPKEFRKGFEPAWVHDHDIEVEDEVVQEYWRRREAKMREIYKKFAKPTTFWYGGNFYSHIDLSGRTDYEKWFLWSNVRAWARTAQKTFWINERWGDGELFRMNYAKDHLEVFIPNI